jgi:hypothetical protein
MKAPNQPLTKNIFLFRLWLGSSFRARSRYGSVSSECLIEFQGPNAASIQLSLHSLFSVTSFQYFALFSAVAIPALAAYA